MQQKMLLVVDCDPACGAGREVCSVLKSLIDSVAQIKYHTCPTTESSSVAKCIDKAISQRYPSLFFLILSPSLLNEHELLARLLGKIGAPLIAVTNEGDPDEINALLKLGVAEYLTPPLDARNILPRVRRLLGKTPKQQRSLAPEDEPYLSAMIGESPTFVSEVSKIPLIAKSESFVLITGETGTGKELFARAIHDLSPRAHKPYIPVNCGAIPIELVENELFGHERGAFTGAGSSLPGLVEAADGGTLFLDEVNSLPLPAQAKLLRFLEEREYRPLGSSKIIKADVRVISAANVDIEMAVNEGKMRLDLYHRLNVITIKLPPLRDRLGDIPLLANHFLRKLRSGSDRIGGIAEEFSREAMHTLMLYEWPGNVRELEHVIERAVVMCKQQTISSIEISYAIGKLPPRSFRVAKRENIEVFERGYLQGVLRICRGNLAQAARIAQMDKTNLRRLIKKYRIDLGSFRKKANRK
ncbi:MAG: sigma-54-dependent Fis family transcriptional regulator [Blastocatellia bacterium]|nr:sigma-54-dependent Fis family transcriptional regulator [Blastocatellia bacterium]